MRGRFFPPAAERNQIEPRFAQAHRKRGWSHARAGAELVGLALTNVRQSRKLEPFAAFSFAGMPL